MNISAVTSENVLSDMSASDDSDQPVHLYSLVRIFTECIFWIAEDTKFLHADSKDQGPVVQSVVSLTSSFVVKMLTVLVNTISNSQLVLLKNM